MSDATRDPYAAAGVAYGVMDPGKLRAQRAAEQTSATLLDRGAEEVRETRGESAYVVDLGDRYVSTVTEALGTKSLVADAVGPLTGRTHYDAIARDTVATILNDLATVGGSPLCLTAYWASGSSEWFGNEARLADLVEGWSSACREAGCSWGGGETQTLPDMIDPSVVVLGGSAVGTISPKEYLLVGSHLRAGDSILVAPAVGIHANGLTLARRVASDLPQGWGTVVPGDPRSRCYGEVLLDPAPLYGPLVEAVQRSGVALHYAAHVTGHGWQKLMRAARPLTYVIERLPEIPPVLDLIVRVAELTPHHSYTTFNMGAGFVLFLPSADVPTAIGAAASCGHDLIPIGYVEDGPKRVVMQPLRLELPGDSLRIR